MRDTDFTDLNYKIYYATDKVRETVQSNLARTNALDWAIPNWPGSGAAKVDSPRKSDEGAGEATEPPPGRQHP